MILPLARDDIEEIPCRVHSDDGAGNDRLELVIAALPETGIHLPPRDGFAREVVFIVLHELGVARGGNGEINEFFVGGKRLIPARKGAHERCRQFFAFVGYGKEVVILVEYD